MRSTKEKVVFTLKYRGGKEAATEKTQVSERRPKSSSEEQSYNGSCKRIKSVGKFEKERAKVSKR